MTSLSEEFWAVSVWSGIAAMAALFAFVLLRGPSRTTVVEIDEPAQAEGVK